VKRIRRVLVNDSGFTSWIQPVKRGYLMQCCDCGLVHRMDFRVNEGRAQFRAQRAERYTAHARRKRRSRT
jgi:hypothetical protein